MTKRALLVTAAAPAGDVLSVVTVAWDGHRLELRAQTSATFVLAGSEQLAVGKCAEALKQFVRKHGVEQIVYRRGAWTGPMRVSASSVKFETILQLLPIACSVVRTQAVSVWVNKAEVSFPAVQTALKDNFKLAQRAAIDTAAYALLRK